VTVPRIRFSEGDKGGRITKSSIKKIYCVFVVGIAISVTVGMTGSMWADQATDEPTVTTERNLAGGAKFIVKIPALKTVSSKVVNNTGVADFGDCPRGGQTSLPVVVWAKILLIAR